MPHFFRRFRPRGRPVTPVAAGRTPEHYWEDAALVRAAEDALLREEPLPTPAPELYQRWVRSGCHPISSTLFEQICPGETSH